MDNVNIIKKLNELIESCDALLYNSDAIKGGDRLTLSNRIVDFLKTTKLMPDTEYLDKINQNLPSEIWMTTQDYIQKTKNMKNVLISLKDKIELSGVNESRPLQNKNEDHGEEVYNFWILIHPRIKSVSKEIFDKYFYKEAAQAAFVEVIDRVKAEVKQRSGTLEDKDGKKYDGKKLMFYAFDSTHQIIPLSDLNDDLGRDIQEGYMHIFAGAAQGIRDPKAHKNFKISPENSIHLIFLASLLMYKLDGRFNY